MRADSPIFNHLPIHLRGEIIEIGAVKLDENMAPGEEFSIYVKPEYFRQMHYKVKKITGIDSNTLANAVHFPEAMQALMDFCGEDPVFITWGNDDKGIFEQNIIIHDLDWDWIGGWKNLQLIYNVQTGGDKNQKSLAEAMEHFGIEQTRVAHDALGDAYNTALVCSKLNMKEGLENYSRAYDILAARAPVKTELPPNTVEGDGPLVHDVYEGFSTKAGAFADERIANVCCPACGKSLGGTRWVNQGDGRYMNIFRCAECGPFLIRVRFKKTMDNTLIANRLVYEADEEMLQFYKEKSLAARKRGRGHRTKHNSRKKMIGQ